MRTFFTFYAKSVSSETIGLPTIFDPAYLGSLTA